MAKVVIIQGGLDGGKTTYMRKLMDELIDVDGIVTLKDSAKRTYYLHEARTRLSYLGLSADMILRREIRQVLHFKECIQESIGLHAYSQEP